MKLPGKLRFAIAFVIAFFGPLGCVKHPADFSVHIDSAFTASETVHVLDALQEWQHRTHGIVKFNRWQMDEHSSLVGGLDPVLDDNLYIIRVANRDDYCPDSEQHLTGTSVAVESQVMGYRIICIWADWTEGGGLTSRTVLHEVGHAVGLDHYEGPRWSVMHPNINETMSSEHLTCEDLGDFCKLYDCNLNCTEDGN